MVSDVPNWLFSTSAFIGFVLCMIPLPWHLEAWNTGTCLYMIWTGLACLNQFINSVVWNSDTINRAPVWCDISSYFIIGSSIAIPAASLCINRRLYQIASVSSVTKSRAQKQRDILVDLAIGVGLPILAMILHVVVQAERFLIIEEVGCFPFTFNTPLAYPLYLTWPLVICLVSATYCARTIRELALRRAQFKEFLATNRNLSSSRYFRLMGLASLEFIFAIPLATYSIYVNAATEPVQPYVSWQSAHAQMGDVLELPTAIWQATTLSTESVELSRWFVVLCAVAFFAFFGFADEAKKNYRYAYMSVAKRVGLSTGSMTATGTWSADGTNPDTSYNSRSAAMPVFITHQTEKKRDSFASFSSRISLPDYGGAMADMKKVPSSPTATTSSSMSKESLPRSPVDVDIVLLPTLPEVSYDISAPPRYAPDASKAV
ncbi:pheromone A receptor-domain-containing protein [Boletus edulis BED1]|uniref:Pheromone A receptor-domain-containing protein n=1 Tax=Boletus edulis BED1 TaxID=1328754 RepID=A0AAD4BUU1_BOLED|nr:pheromone A receptor-domain-containing protein [Boletus edulis BED1]